MNNKCFNSNRYNTRKVKVIVFNILYKVFIFIISSYKNIHT